MPSEDEAKPVNWMAYLPSTLERVKKWQLTTGHALEIVTKAEAFRDDLRARNTEVTKRSNRPAHLGPYYDEIQELDEQCWRVRAELHMRPDFPIVCIFRRPERFLKVKDAPGLRGITPRLPALMVCRNGQTPFIELDGRHRVRDWWALLVDGVPHVDGPKRWIMKNAQGAAMMGPTGQVPGWILLTGLARRRQRHKMRRDRRRLEAARKRARELNAWARRVGRGDRHYVGADVKLRLTMDDQPFRDIASWNYEEVG